MKWTIAAIASLLLLILYFYYYSTMPPPNGTPQNQTYQNTAFNRYPILFRAVASQKHDNTTKRKILSFGSSSGEEPFTFATQYFTGDEIYGCDLKPSYKLTKGIATIFFSSRANLELYGPFDIIFANSVLCRHPHFNENQYPFGTFEDTVEMLDSHLKKGGILVISNASYRFQDTNVSAKYRAHVPEECVNEKINECLEEFAFVPQHYPSGTRTESNTLNSIFLKT